MEELHDFYTSVLILKVLEKATASWQTSNDNQFMHPR